MTPLRVVFMGSPAFAIPALAGLLKAGHEIVLVLSQPDRPAGRGRQPTPPAVVAAYGLILRREVLELPRLGCLNVHASLLPRHRGAAPILAAILAGDAETGVCLMQMEA